jgi:hypothetical protein
MKVKIAVEFEVEPDHELSPKEHSNMVGMLSRLTRNRVLAYHGQRVGGEHVTTGWEVDIKAITVGPLSKT